MTFLSKEPDVERYTPPETRDTMTTDKPSTTFRINPISPITNTHTDLTASKEATERYRQRNARMRRCLRIGFKRVEMGDDILEGIDYVHNPMRR
jgi:hypothetical protein